MALGVYLRKFFIGKIEADDITVDTKSFGKFSIVNDPSADPDDLYPKKIVFEPTGTLARSCKNQERHGGTLPASIPIDFARLTRLCNLQNQNQVKRNLELMSNHLG